MDVGLRSEGSVAVATATTVKFRCTGTILIFPALRGRLKTAIQPMDMFAATSGLSLQTDARRRYHHKTQDHVVSV